MKTHPRRALSVVGLFACVAAVDISGSAAQAAAFTNCAMQVYADGSAKAGELDVTCYRTFAEAIFIATGGRVELASSATVDSLTASEQQAISTSAGALDSVVLAYDYPDVQGGGMPLVIYGSAMCPAASYSLASMPAGWDNTISSAHTYAGCQSDLYTGTSYSGTSAHVGVNSGASWGGTSFNDQASSQKVY